MRRRHLELYLIKSNNVDAVHGTVGGNNSFLIVCTDKSFEYLHPHTETDWGLWTNVISGKSLNYESYLFSVGLSLTCFASYMDILIEFFLCGRRLDCLFTGCVGAVTEAAIEGPDSTLERGFLPYHPLTKEIRFLGAFTRTYSLISINSSSLETTIVV